MTPWAIVTGGAGALGARIVSRLQDIGVTVVVLDRQQGFTSSDSATYHQVDLSNYSAVEEVCTNLVTRRGPPRYVVAAAGLYERRSILQYDADAAERAVGSNLLSLTYLLRFVLGPMLAGTEGHVVALSSQVGVTGTSDPLYAASKAGVTAFIKSLAREYGRRGPHSLRLAADRLTAHQWPKACHPLVGSTIERRSPSGEWLRSMR